MDYLIADSRLMARRDNMFVWIVALVLLVLCSVLSILDEEMLPFAVVCGVFLFSHLVVMGFSLADSISANGYFLSSQENFKAMKLTVSKINEISLVKNTAKGSMVGGLENMQQSSKTSEALLEYKNAFINYNTKLNSRKIKLNNFFLRGYVVKLPEGLEEVKFELQ